jgi:hypothetical protein
MEDGRHPGKSFRIFDLSQDSRVRFADMLRNGLPITGYFGHRARIAPRAAFRGNGAGRQEQPWPETDCRPKDAPRRLPGQSLDTTLFPPWETPCRRPPKNDR